MVLFLAVATASLCAVVLAKLADQRANFGNGAVHPDRQHGVPTRNPNPAQRVGQGHAVLGVTIDVQSTEPRKTGAAAHRLKAAQGNVRGIGRRWSRSRANGRQQVSQRGIVPKQEVQQRNPFWVDALHIGQRINFLADQVEGQARVLHRIVPGVGDELVALDEPVVRIGWERDRREFERVEDRQIEARQSGVLAPELRHVMATQVVPYEQPGACRCCVDAANYICRFKPSGRQAHNGIVVRPNRADLEDSIAVRRIGLDVDRKGRPADDD